jgi:SAM-dependent methyltransferase
MINNILDYYNKAAKNWPKYRKSKSYYWNSVTRYCNYFIPVNHRVLEIGCATGELLAGLDATDKTGIDFSPGMVALARKQFPDIKFEIMQAEGLHLKGPYDTIIMSNLVGVLPDLETALEQLNKIVHPGSRIIITSYNRLWEPLIRMAEWLRIKHKTPVQNWLSRQDLENILYLKGFETYRTSHSMLIPYRIPVVSWFLNRILSRLPFFNLFCLNNYLFARPEAGCGPSPEEYSTSIVIPARNEAGNIEKAIQRIPSFGKHVEIIFVEGNSTDDTMNKIMEMHQKYKNSHDIKVIRQPGKGKGDAVRAGFDIATGDILLILDADLTVPPEELPRFYNALRDRRGELINGVRLVYPMEKNAMRPLNTLGNHFFSLLFSWLLERPVKDTLCGTKVMFRNDYEKLVKNRSFFGDFDPFGDFDLLFGAHKLNLKIIDLPVHYMERKYGNTNINRFRHGFILLKMSAFAAYKIKFR